MAAVLVARLFFSFDFNCRKEDSFSGGRCFFIGFKNRSKFSRFSYFLFLWFSFHSLFSCEFSSPGQSSGMTNTRNQWRRKNDTCFESCKSGEFSKGQKNTQKTRGEKNIFPLNLPTSGAVAILHELFVHLFLFFYFLKSLKIANQFDSFRAAKFLSKDEWE